MKIFLAIFVLVFSYASPAPAESAAEFLKSISGTWRGKGTIYVSEKSKETPVRCKISSSLKQDEGLLKNEGQCATAQRKVKISGAISFGQTGNRVKGSYLNLTGDFVVTKSGGSVEGNKLTLNTTFMNEKVNKISRVRSIIRRLSKSKLMVSVFEKKGDNYLPRGIIEFTR